MTPSFSLRSDSSMSSDTRDAEKSSVDLDRELERRDAEKALEEAGSIGRCAPPDETAASLASSSEDDGSSQPEGQNDARHHENEREEPTGIAGVLSRVLSRTSTKSSWNPGPPPDGGLRAWLAVLGGHLVVMNTWGIVNSFGVFQAYYATTLSPISPSAISWIGSLQIFLIFFIGTLTGRLTDAGYFRHVFLVGSVLQTLGIFTASAASSHYWQLLLAQGVCLGLGSGCLFCPALAVLAPYWGKKRGLAIGIAASGTATGGLIFPSMVRQMLPEVGFPWTMRAIGFVQVVGLAVAGVCLKPRIPARKGGSWVEWPAFRELEYSFYAAGSFFCFWGVYFAFYYQTSFARDVVGLSYTASLNLLLVLNGVGAIGRLVPNHIADRVGPINVFVPTAAVAGICVICWTAVHTPAGLYVWACFYGMAAGGIQSLFPAGLTSLTTDLRKTGVRMGMVFTIVSFATLTGPPIDGALISAAGEDGKNYTGAFIFSGAVLLIGSGFMFAARTVKMRRQGTGWAVKV